MVHKWFSDGSYLLEISGQWFRNYRFWRAAAAGH